MSIGVLYVCNTSRQHQSELHHSFKSLKKYNPELKAAVFTDLKKSLIPEFDYVFPIDGNINPLKNKVGSLLLSPFDKTLYLDVDTEICGNILELFKRLDTNDLSLTNEPKIDYTKRPPLFLGYAREEEINTGFILYKKSAEVMSFLREWNEEIQQVDDNRLIVGKLDDQLLFNRAWANTKKGVIHSILDNKVFNTRYRAFVHMDSELKSKVLIKHWHYLNKSKLSIKAEEYYFYMLRTLFNIKREQIM